MPSFDKGPNFRTPFGKNVPWRSTRGMLFEHYTCAKSTVPAIEVDGVDQKVLQPGVAMAKITSGADSGKVGPVDQAASDGRQTEANFVGINSSFLPWQFLERDVEVAVVYTAAVYQDRCLEVASGDWVVLTDTTRDALVAKTGLNILFKEASSEL